MSYRGGRQSGKPANNTNARNRSKNGNKNNFTQSRDAEIARLEERISGADSNEIPERGHVPPLCQKVKFSTLPISLATLQGLEDGVGRRNKRNGKGANNNNKHRVRKRDYDATTGESSQNENENETEEKENDGFKNFTIMTDIQNACLPHALGGRDILGAAKTGSGKTLAFLIPLVERMFRSKWSPDDGVGAIVLSPTRELAMQIFDVLCVIGAHHHFSAGLVVGGKADALTEEQYRLPRTNIIIATPGRLLQHLEETPMFDASSCQVLVLDEADRILDMGFRNQLYSILEYLPDGGEGGRQTMLFSATQTKNVKSLACLSLSKPEYIGVHDKESTATPEQLVQSLIVCPLPHKLDMVFSFIKSHLKQKTLIFFSTCSQVRFIYEMFCTLQPGVSVLCLHGKIKQEKRTKIYFEFLNKPYAVLLATDVAARGLDFPNIDWVVQADAPEDRDAYIHRVGRTARNKKKGKSLLLVLPSEHDGMVDMLEKHSIPVNALSVNPSKAVSISQRAASIVASKPDLNVLAKKAFTSYLRSLSLMPNKDIFGCNIMKDLPLEEFAASLGLPSTPSTRFLKKLDTRDEYREKKNKNFKLERLKEQIRQEKLKKRIENLGGGDLSSKATTNLDTIGEEVEGDDLLVVKQKHEWADGDLDENAKDASQIRSEKVRPSKRIRVEGSAGMKNTKIVFDDDGKERPSVLDSATHAFDASGGDNTTTLEEANEAFLDKVKDRLSMTREQDIAQEKARIRDRHRKKKLKDKGLGSNADEEGDVREHENIGVTLADVSSSDSDSDSSSDSDSDSDSSSSDSDNDNNNLAEQEALALAMLQGS
jgi:ATP-dependent RNA helicase DDX10/DBP4